MQDASLFSALLCCETESEVERFLKDLLSDGELLQSKARWEIAKTFLSEGKAISKRKAMQRHNRTQGPVERVYDCVFGPLGGYRLAYERLARKGVHE